jgi:DNA-binding CsgD family transcriptional regulator
MSALPSSGEVEGALHEPERHDQRHQVQDVLGEELYVLSYPVPQLRYPANITLAEREIIQLLLDGLSTAQISKMRRTSPRTVWKQLVSIYDKAGVTSRAELVAWMLGRS